MPRIVALDYGLKRIGLAISDENARIALPLPLVTAGKTLDETIDRILASLSSYQGKITTIVVGMPLLMSGKTGEMALIAERFVQALSAKTTIPIQTIDERLSTAQADRALKELDYSRKKRSKVVDSTAAAILLQTYLDRTT